MKESDTLFTSIVGIVAIILLVAILIGLSNKPQPTLSREQASSVISAYPAFTDNAYPIEAVPSTRAVEHSNIQPSPFPSPIPTSGRGYVASVAKRVELSDSAVKEVFPGYELSGDNLFLVTLLENGNRALLKVDVKTGRADRLVEIPFSSGIGFIDLRADGQNVIWSGYTEDKTEKRLYYLSLSNKQYTEIQAVNFSYPSVKGNGILWVDARNNNIIRYDFESRAVETVVQQESSIATSSPVACSDNEIAFLDNFSSGSSSSFVSQVSADLVLYSVDIKRRSVVGRVTHAPNGPIDRNWTFDCDSEKLVWVANRVDTNQANDVTVTPELHIYTFNEAKSTKVNTLSGDFEPYATSVMLDGDIIISRIGYDLSENSVFSPYIESLAPKGVRLANSRLVWSETGTDMIAIRVINLMKVDD